MEISDLKIAPETKKSLSDEVIRSRLLAADLTQVSNARALFEFAKLTEDKALCLVARQKANDLAAKGSMEAYELVKEAYLWLAPRDFDSYMIYLEWNRKPQERFYLPRRRQLKVAVDALQALADDRLDELFISCPPRIGKLLADSTPVLTTSGWKNHGDLRVGDYVFNPDGKAVRVIAVHPKHHTTHTITMTDGSQFKCHFRHEWKVWDSHNRSERILETQEIAKNVDNGKAHGTGHRYNYHLCDVAPIDGMYTELPIKPYTFGAWIGDGSNRAPIINIAEKDAEIVHAIESDGYPAMNYYKRDESKIVNEDCIQVSFSGLRAALHTIGLCNDTKTTEKYIPDCYLTASAEQRLELLAGLLDTDGFLMKKQSRYEFSTSYENIRNAVETLISTFGWRVSVTEVDQETVTLEKYGTIQRSKRWRISFNPDKYVPCRLERKQLKSFKKHKRISIQSIVESEPEPGNCITVEGGMYLIGKRLIPTHNTSLLMFYMTWAMGRDSEKANLYCAYSDTITQAFYNGVLEILNDNQTYLWHDVFPTSQIAATNSKNETINIDRNKRYASLTCRSLYGTLNGAVDVNGMLMSDDLLSGIEEALNKDRLITAWGKVDNNMLSRAKGNAKILWCGTRWSMADPIGLRIDTVLNSDKFRNRRVQVINMPALNEKDESNFDYLYGVGFDTATYHMRRASFERNNDMASWNAQYMGEPIEREGTVFSPGDMRFFNGLLTYEPADRIFMAVDPAWGGGDYVASPVCVKINDDLYVVDVVYDNSDKKITQKRIAEKAVKWGIGALQIEATKTTASYAEGVQEALNGLGKRMTVITKPAPATEGGKAQRIFDKAPDIRDRMIFLDEGHRSKEYQMFMQNVFSFKITGKNKHDDAPDSLAMAIDMDTQKSIKAKVTGRLW